MKTFTLIGFSISILVFLGAVYLQFVVVPESEIAEIQMMQYDADFMGGNTDFNNTPEYRALVETFDAKVIVGMYLFFAAIASFLLVIYPAIRKNSLAILGVILSLVSFFIGATHGTHMFS
jgi:hypothetical protein